MNRDKILLTGATGFIGSHILEALTAAGFPVSVLVRPQADLSHLATLKPEVRRGDIRELESLCAAVRACGQVVHAAACVKDWGPQREFYETNVTGTLNVLKACWRQGINRVTMAGTVSSYGEEDSPKIKDENSPDNSHYPYFLDRVFPSKMNWYRDTKALATQQAVAFAHQHQLNLTVIEPVWVYGEREFGTGFYTYVKAVQTGQRFMPGSRRNLFHVVYARDLAKAFLLACQKKLPGIERLIVGNIQAQPMCQIFNLFCLEAGLKPPCLLPRWSVYPPALLLELAFTLARSRRPPLLTRGRVNMFYDNLQFSVEKARQKLGFQCDYSLEQGIRKTVSWYKSKNYI
jgi:nucleoside-diphosphate-sugar epimerase